MFQKVKLNGQLIKDMTRFIVELIRNNQQFTFCNQTVQVLKGFIVNESHSTVSNFQSRVKEH